MEFLFRNKSSLLLGLMGLTFFWLVSTALLKEPPSSAANNSLSQQQETAPTVDFFEEARLRRDRMLQEKEDAAELAKKQATKEKSVECVFWKQQQALRKSDKVDSPFPSLGGNIVSVLK